MPFYAIPRAQYRIDGRDRIDGKDRFDGKDRIDGAFFFKRIELNLYCM